MHPDCDCVEVFEEFCFVLCFKIAEWDFEEAVDCVAAGERISDEVLHVFLVLWGD